MAAEMCPYAEAGIECRFFCAQCNLKHTCLYCAVEYRSRVKDVHLKRLITHSEYLDSLPEPPNFRAEDIISAGFAEKLRIAREAELERRRQVEIEAKEAEKRRLQAENEAKEAELERRRQVEIKAKEAEQRHRQTEIEAKEAEQRRRQAEDEARDRMNRLKESVSLSQQANIPHEEKSKETMDSL